MNRLDSVLQAELSTVMVPRFEPLSLLDSQFADLQPPQAEEVATVFDVAMSPAQIVASLCARQQV